MQIILRRGVEWRISSDPVDYPESLGFMESRARQIREGSAPECVWLLSHPPLISEGTSAKPEELLEPDRFPVFRGGRGGRYVYHGPGQRVAYVLLDLARRTPDLRWFVCSLEQWIIDALSSLGVEGERRDGRVGVWVEREGGREDKIAAIGVRIRRWVSLHGICLNVDPCLDHYRAIVPCGLRGFGVTSMAALGKGAPMEKVDRALISAFDSVFGEKLRR
ncbi:octanoyltransferase [Alphaproteobacteria bacterium]|nr:octanoyltransferase [Alphaproteobacteria bacterium]